VPAWQAQNAEFKAPYHPKKEVTEVVELLLCKVFSSNSITTKKKKKMKD
jgi:hypothetical protein